MNVDIKKTKQKQTATTTKKGHVDKQEAVT